jgi:hypothetical protein
VLREHQFIKQCACKAWASTVLEFQPDSPASRVIGYLEVLKSALKNIVIALFHVQLSPVRHLPAQG